MGNNEIQENNTTRKSISLENKIQMIKLDSDEHQSQISAILNLATSTIRTIATVTNVILDGLMSK